MTVAAWRRQRFVVVVAAVVFAPPNFSPSLRLTFRAPNARDLHAANNAFRGSSVPRRFDLSRLSIGRRSRATRRQYLEVLEHLHVRSGRTQWGKAQQVGVRHHGSLQPGHQSRQPAVVRGEAAAAAAAAATTAAARALEYGSASASGPRQRFLHALPVVSGWPRAPLPRTPRFFLLLLLSRKLGSTPEALQFLC